MNKKILLDLVGLELIALIVVVGYKLSPVLLPKADVTVQPDPLCNLQMQPCEATLPNGGKVRLEMTERPIPMVKPFDVVVTTSGFSPSRVEVDMAGVDMNMGYNRPELQLRGEGRYAAQLTLPVCITGQMDWQATVLLESGNERIAVPYRFTSGTH